VQVIGVRGADYGSDDRKSEEKSEEKVGILQINKLLMAILVIILLVGIGEPRKLILFPPWPTKRNCSHRKQKAMDETVMFTAIPSLSLYFCANQRASDFSNLVLWGASCQLAGLAWENPTSMGRKDSGSQAFDFPIVLLGVDDRYAAAFRGRRCRRRMGQITVTPCPNNNTQGDLRKPRCQQFTTHIFF